MAKNYTYEVKDYDAYQHASAISNDLNSRRVRGGRYMKGCLYLRVMRFHATQTKHPA